jgi:secreted PhoX family phosphatase
MSNCVLPRLTSLMVLMFTWMAGSAPVRAAPPDPEDGGPVTSVDRALLSQGYHHTAEGGAQPLRSVLALASGGPEPSPALGEPGLSFRYVETMGQVETPYVEDVDHLNHPEGIYIDSGNVYVVEVEGARGLMFDSTGTHQLTIGHMGQHWSHDDFLGWPKDITVNPVDGHIWVTIPHAAKEFDASGALVSVFPEADPWASGSDNDHFNEPHGIVFDNSGRMFVADEWNSRVQVFEFDGDGNPLYQASIPGFSQPIGLVIDAAGRLYVSEAGGARVQRCTESAGWTCVSFHGTGAPGSGPEELDYPFGLGIDSSDNIYIADGNNARVKKCDSAGACSVLVSGLGWPADVATDSSGNVYISDWSAMTIDKYTGAGVFVGTFAGVDQIPYQTASGLMDRPWGVALAQDGGLYVTESGGRRLIKITSAGAQEWAVGQLGQCAGGADGLCDPEGSAAVGPDGKVYLADTWNHRIQIYDSDGTYYATFGSYGDGQYEFECPSGVGFNPVDGDMYVVDRCNQRIQVFSSGHLYETTLGVLDTPGDDSAHLDNPRGVAFDSSGHVYVADNGNLRVQHCVRSGNSFSCSTFAGVLDTFGSELDYLSPTAVAVDDQGRVYVTDEWNNRVQVFDAAGAYLATMGGAWGALTGNMRGPLGVAVAGDGTVYSADTYNHRILVHVPGVPGWRQDNLSGFGSPAESINALVPFGASLYAGTWTTSGNGAQVWRRSGGAWTGVMMNGFGNPLNQGIDHLIEFEGGLYAGTYNWDDATQTSEGGEVWRSFDGALWEQVVDGGFGTADDSDAFRFFVHGDSLYVGTWGADTIGGAVWRSPSGDSGSWLPSVTGGFGNSANYAMTAIETHGGDLYVGTRNGDTGAELWRSTTGDPGTWVPVMTGGFGDSGNFAIDALEEFDGVLFASASHTAGAGNEVWRCLVCSGSDWEQVVDNGMGDDCARGMSALEVLDRRLYWVAGQAWGCTTGLDVFRTASGDLGDWHQVGFDGFGDSNNRAPYRDNSVTVFDNMLWIGTSQSSAQGGEVWVLLKDLFLPLVMRNHS